MRCCSAPQSRILLSREAASTWAQRFTVNDQFYKPGGPVFLVDSGENAIENYPTLLSTGVIGEPAQNTRYSRVIYRSMVLIKSIYKVALPSSWSTDTMVPHSPSRICRTTCVGTQWIRHLQTVNFAKTAEIPGYEGEDFAAPGRPWILYGVSVAGGNVAFTLKTYPDIIYGTISSSGIVQEFHSLPQFYYRAQQFEPQDCIASIENIVEKYSLPLTSKLSVDVLPSNNRYIARSQGRHSYGQIETVFGLEDLLDIGDFGLTVTRSRWSTPFFASYTNNEPWKNPGNYADYIKSRRSDVPGGPQPRFS
ncbi:hypothetical protein B0H14DRAFT_3156147 [Mycena olivaceomarginata]|nr:hypothetical protein B0H14DRAFT_3156147 [Mycena olivaceomarginata]